MSDPERTFRYHDGTAEIHGDPAALRNALVLETRGRVNQLLRDYYARVGEDDAALAKQAAAASVLLPAVRRVFGLKPLDPATGKGCTDDDADQVLCDFQNYLSCVKKKRATSPSTAPPTAPPSSEGRFYPKNASA